MTCLSYVPMQLSMCQRIGNMPKACPYVMTFSLAVWITTKIPNEMPQQCQMDYQDALETDIVLLLVKFERLRGG